MSLLCLTFFCWTLTKFDKEKGQYFHFYFIEEQEIKAKNEFSVSQSILIGMISSVLFTISLLLLYCLIVFFYVTLLIYPIREAELSGNHLQFSDKRKLRFRKVSIILEEFFKRSL